MPMVPILHEAEREERIRGAAMELYAALERSRVALDDWLHTYAPEHCGTTYVADTYARIMANGGTLAYIADVQQQNRRAFAKADGKRT